MLGGNLDMLAEHAIVADLERGDAGSLAILRFEGGDRLAPVAGRLAQRVERGVIAFGDIAALRRVDRRRLDQRAGEFVNERAMAVEAWEPAREQEIGRAHV